MRIHPKLDSVYIPSSDVVTREIEGDLIIVPLVRGIGDLEEDIFTLNETGKEIWISLDKQKKLKQVINDLIGKYPDDPREIEQDVLGFVNELLNRKMLVEVAPGNE